MSKAPFVDRVRAKIQFEWGSRAISRLPWLQKMVIGEDYPARLWEVAEVDSYDLMWHSVPGDKKSGRLPRNYHSAAKLSVPVEGWRKQLANRPGYVYAGAFAVGGAVVVTEIFHDEFETATEVASEDRPVVDLVLREGKGILEGAAGAYHHGHRLFVPHLDPAIAVDTIPMSEIHGKFPNAILL